MKDENVGNSFIPDGSNGGTVYIRINIPELKVQKCLQFQLDDSVWQAKQRILATFAKDLKDGLNYGLYCPPSNGRAGKFLDEERFLREYPLQGPIGFLEFKYKRRVYKLLQINQRKIKQLHTKANLKQFLDYVRSGQADKISKYTAKGLDPNYHDPESGETPLTVSATIEKDHAKPVIVSLVSGGAHLDFRNRLGLTPLHKASIRGNVEALKTMLDLGAAPNYKDGRGLTPLYYSVANDTDPRCSEMLLHERAIIGTPDEQGWYEIHHACRHGRVQHLELLIFYGADMDVQNATGNTPLHICALNNQESCARVLLFRGAGKEILNYSNQVPYQVAIIGGNFDLAEIIKHHKHEDIVPFREVPSYSSRRKNCSVTPSMRAVMRCRSDPRLNILTWEKGGPDMSSHDDSQSNLSWKGYNSDSPRMSISSSSSSGPVISVGEQGFWEGRVGNQEGWFPSNHVNEVQMRQRSGSVGDIGDTVAVHRNTLAALVESKGDGPRTVVLQKGRDGFGFVLRGAKSKHVPVSSLDFHPTSEYPALQYLDSVDQGSMAEKAGLKSGDFILEINGQNVVQASHERVVELIKASGDTLQLRVVTVRPAEKNNWFVHQDGCMTLPSRGKARAPQPPKRDPNTALSYSKARSKSFAEGLAEIEKLDQTLAQYDSTSRSKSASMTGLDKMGGVDTDPKVASIRARHAAKRVSCIHLDGEYVDVPGNEGHRRTTPPVPPKKYASPSELRIQRYHKKYQQGGTLEKARSTPNLIDGESGKEVIYATPTLNAGNGTLVKNGGSRQFSSNGYKTVLSIGSGDSDSSTSSDSITGVSRGSPRQNIYSVPHMAPRVTSLRAATHNTANVEHGVTTGTNVRREGAMPDRPKKPGPSPSGVVIPPPPRKPAPHPPVKSEVVKIIPSTIYANVSSDIQARKTQQAESPYESSFRPGANAKVTKEPDVVTASVEQAKLKKHQRNGSMGSLQYAQAMHAISVEEKQRFGSFPRHGHGALEIARTSPNEEGPRSVSFADDKVFENAANFIEKHPNASLLVTANMKSAEKGRLSKELYEPAPDYDAESDEGETALPAPLSLRSAQTTTSHRSSSSSASSASNRSDIPVHIHTQTTGTSAGHEEKTSVTIISVGNDSPKSQPARLHKTDEQSHYAISSNIPRRGSGDIDPPKNYSMESSVNTDRGGHAENSDDSASSGNSLRNQIRMAAMARDKRREEQYNDIVKDSVTAAPPAPPPPPPPGPPAAPPPPLISADGNAKMSRSSSQASVPGMPSALEIQSAAAERQTRIQNGGGEIVINRPNGEDTLRKKPMDHTQAAILAAVAKRRSVLEHTSEQSIVEQIESRLNKTKKLQSAKFYGSSSTMQKQADVKPVVTSTPPRTADKPNPATAEPVKTAPKPSPHSKQPTVIASRANRVENTTVTRKTDNQSVRTETAKPASSDFLAQAEKARQLYLQKKNTESSPKEVVKQTDNSIKSAQSAGVKVSSQLPLIKSQNNNNKVLVIEKSSGKTNPSEEISNANKSISKDDNLSIRDKIKSFEKKLDLSAALKGKSAYEVRGVTMDHSYTEGDFAKANGHVSNNFTYKDELPPPMMAPPPAFSDSSEPPVSDDVVQIEIIPPPIHFGGEEQAGSLDHCNSAFGHDDSVSLHSSVSTLSTLSSEHGDISSDRVSYSGRQITTLDEVIAPPPPGFDDNHFNDNNYDDVHSNNFIPPPPEFQSGNNEKNTNMRLMNKPFISKTVDRWSCVDVLDWLESLSMLQYKSSFARQCIDGKRLVGLNRNDYIELGVTQVGHRMNIERSIKKLALQNTV